MFLKSAAVAIALLVSPFAESAKAAEWKFQVVNKSRTAANEFRTREDGQWSENWITERIEPGDSFDMDFGTDKGDCTIRTQIHFIDGTYFDANVNYCKVQTLYIYERRLTWE